MQIIKSPPRPFDIDGTLIVHRSESSTLVEVLDPITDEFIIMGRNEAMIRLLKEEKHRGGFIVAWSRGGFEWATNVIDALNLKDCVDIIMDKPLVYFDNEEVVNWMKDRVFIGPEVKYKR